MTEPTILLIETDAATARQNAETLIRAGFLVEIDPTGAARATHVPDVIVLSVTGLTHSVRRRVARISVPHVVISSDPADAIRAVEFGCAAVLIRPVMYDELVKAVRHIVPSNTFGTGRVTSGARQGDPVPA
jgi:DNA-binding response OmpR family regulator